MEFGRTRPWSGCLADVASFRLLLIARFGKRECDAAQHQAERNRKRFILASI
jgi:hypothetical protein